MGTVTTSIDDRLPAGVVALGVTLILVMAAAMICSIARDIAEMRVLWNAVAAGQERQRMERRQLLQKQEEIERGKKKPPRKHHGVSLEETWMRERPAAVSIITSGVSEMPAAAEEKTS